MQSFSPPINRRILVIDDNRSIHEDFRKILCPPRSSGALDALEEALFGEAAPEPELPIFEVDSAYQGEEGVQRVREALKEGRPYALAFVDIRMPPGLDGVETTSRLWEVDENLQVVICSAYADYSWEEMMRRLGLSQRLLILRKPFDNIEVRQLAHSLSEKWELLRYSRLRMEDLEKAVEGRTRALEEANARLRQELEDRARLEARLAQAQRLQALGRLAAGLAHEVNNPLSFLMANLGHIRGELEREARQGRGDDWKELLETCDDALIGAERIRRIIQDVRVFSRVESEERTRVDVHEALAHAISMARGLVGMGLPLVQEMAPVPPVHASAFGLAQVFSGILVNAAQAVSDRGAEATVHLATRVQEDGQVVVEVRDNGGGIPPEDLDRIFDPFFTTRPVGRGTGLGLSVCYGVINGLGGTISAESTKGQGTTFRIVLPAAQ